MVVEGEVFHFSRDAGEQDTIIVIEGPKLVMTEPDSVPSRFAWPTYSVWIQIYKNAERMTLLDFVRLLNAEQVDWAEQSPAEVAEITERFSLPVADTVAGLPAVWYLGYSPDALVVHHFFARGKHVVEFQYILDDVYRHPLIAMQEVIYAFMLENFRWLEP